jgi:hypothetical protein
VALQEGGHTSLQLLTGSPGGLGFGPSQSCPREDA